MAGEWLKFDASTPDKPEVLAITVAMGWDDPDLTVGKLLRVWRWFDQQTIDGNAHGVTAALLDRLLGVSGLCNAMANVGWLVVTSDGLSLPNFDRHNGKTAKDRALTAKRVANHKSNAKGNAEGNAPIVTNALPREEKRREDIKDTPQAALPAKKRAASKIPLPEDFSISESVQAWATSHGHGALQRHLENFIGVCKAKGYTYADWDAAFMNAIRSNWAKVDLSQVNTSSDGRPPKPEGDYHWRNDKWVHRNFLGLKC